MRGLFVTMLLSLFLAVVFAASAGTLELVYEFDDPVIAISQGDAISVTMPGAFNRVIAGQPVLPVKTAKVLIPSGERVTFVEVIPGPWQEISLKHPVEHGPRSRTTSGESAFDLIPDALPDPQIYYSMSVFPKSTFAVKDAQFKKGVQVLPVNLSPVRYRPAEGVLLTTDTMRVVVTTESVDAPPAGTLPYRGTSADRGEIAALVDNPEALISYQSPVAGTLDDVDYLMITPEALVTSVQTYADYKAGVFNMSVEVVTLEWIEANVAGADAQEKMRNHIINLYTNSNLQYVLLVGDADGQGSEFLPIRHLWVSGTDPDGMMYHEDAHMASDLYFGCLDGNYNSDGDEFFGETTDGPGGADVDLLFDVHVGRFPVENEAELGNMVNKTVAFESAIAPYKALFVGETLDSITQGGDSKDVVYGYMPDVPVTTLFERDGTYTYDALVQNINSNEYQWLNHLGHANVTYNMDFYSSSVGAIANTAYYLGYTQGCYCGSIDGRDSYGWYSYDDCVIEYFTAKHGAGAFAYLANTRYGFYLTGRTDGPSNVYDWEFADALVNENIQNVGAANDDSKEDSVGMLDPMNMMRWVYYELMLFGDPHTPLQFDCDEDEDGHDSLRCGGTDCNDLNPVIYEGAEELCDGLDNDCDGDPGADEADADEDGYRICENDCNDADEFINPEATEDCLDGVDNDCNDLTDEEDPACQSGDDDDDDNDTGDDDDDTGDDDTSGDDDDDDDTSGDDDDNDTGDDDDDFSGDDDDDCGY